MLARSLARGLVGRGLTALRSHGSAVGRKMCTEAPKSTPPPPPPPPPEPGFLLRIQQQVSNEIATANEHPAKLFGFIGACCNWFLGLSAVYDASSKGAEVISLPMT